MQLLMFTGHAFLILIRKCYLFRLIVTYLTTQRVHTYFMQNKKLCINSFWNFMLYITTNSVVIN
jgi:hypothetical protein